MPLKLHIDISDTSINTAADNLGVSPDRLIYVLENYLLAIGSKTKRPVSSGPVSPDAMAEVRLAIAGGDAGFRGGWVSSGYLPKALSTRLPKNKRRDLMARLGYHPHPALVGGRCYRPVAPDGARPVLYVSAGHPALALTKAQDVEAAYSAAQKGEVI